MSGASLFRQEVVDARGDAWLGSIAIAAPVSRWLITTLALAVAAAILALLLLGHYTKRQTVNGELVPSTGLITFVAPVAGTVSRLQVADGQPVKEGDVLLELSSDEDSAALGSTSTLIAAQLNAQEVGLKTDLINQQAVAKKQESALHTKISLLGEQLGQISGQLLIDQKQVDGNREMLERIEPLGAKHYVTEVQIEQQRAAVLETENQLKSMKRQQLDVRQQLDEARQQLEQLPLDLDSKRNDTRRQLSNINQSIAQNEQQRAIVLRAKHDGVVAMVLPKAGQAVSVGQPLVSILPKGSSLQAQLLVPSRAIGFVDAGSKVVLRYEAFPYQKFGQHFGRVKSISRSALTSAEVGALTGKQGDEPLYRVEVALDQQSMLLYGKEERLKPGMMLQADVLMERRSLIEWMFEPLYGIARKMAVGDHND